jgi:hypothetical protein
MARIEAAIEEMREPYGSPGACAVRRPGSCLIRLRIYALTLSALHCQYLAITVFVDGVGRALSGSSMLDSEPIQIGRNRANTRRGEGGEHA